MAAKTTVKKVVKINSSKKEEIKKPILCKKTNNIEIILVDNNLNNISAYFAKYLDEKLRSMDFSKHFLSMNFDSISIIIDNPNFSFNLNSIGIITFKRLVNPVIEIIIPIDKLQFISRGVKPE